MGPPAPPLPSPSSLGDARVCVCTHTHTHTHISYLSCVFYFLMFRVAHWLGVFTSGRGGGWFLGGPKKGREFLEGNWGVTITPALSRNSFFSPSRSPAPTPPPPQRGGPCLQ
ncbi:unnamed protein product [Rangifer tarandus platyrhynchus]|uniref:Uncharacterized protein n=1 Tax=Rangifer tarandus platyrhynchus TaxID=3082113 RepID=A0AC59YXZ2_RANTA